MTANSHERLRSLVENGLYSNFVGGEIRQHAATEGRSEEQVGQKRAEIGPACMVDDPVIGDFSWQRTEQGVVW